jgi:hypothetical protein
MTEQIIKVTAQQFDDVRKKLRLAHLSNPFGADILDDAKAKEILRGLGVEPRDNVTYRFVVV